MGRVGLERGRVVSVGSREDVEGTGIGAVREVVNEATYLGRRTEEDLPTRKKQHQHTSGAAYNLKKIRTHLGLRALRHFRGPLALTS